ncbi:hypothetical protein M758_UG152200 [Ceratodon purpureus]|nr:hypothetical protein M758_UG152200 [Ceratodon purpureus]
MVVHYCDRAECAWLYPGHKSWQGLCEQRGVRGILGEEEHQQRRALQKEVSPRMGKRIRYLFLSVFQRPIGSNDAIPFHFGRGLLAERKGFPIDWAEYARKMTHRGTGDLAHIPGPAPLNAPLMEGGNPFVFMTIEDLRRTTPPNKWPKYKEDSNTESVEGSDDGWNINVQFGAVVEGRSSSFDTGGGSTGVADVAGPSTVHPLAQNVTPCIIRRHSYTIMVPEEREEDTHVDPKVNRKRSTPQQKS